MTQPYIGEIQLFGFSFSPLNWAYCNGDTLMIRQYTALFSLLGTQFGGDGTTTFQLPNFTGRAICNQGQGLGRTQRVMGESFGSDSVTLTTNEMPAHGHNMTLYYQPTGSLRAPSPTPGSHLMLPGATQPMVLNTQPNTTFAPNMFSTAGQNLPHENRQPYLAVNFCIALAGNFPSFG